MSAHHNKPSTNTSHTGETTIDTVPSDAHPVLLIRLKPKWKPSREEIEDGYVRAGFGWREGISSLELRDSVRSWWKFSPATLKRRHVTHVVAVADGQTRALYKIGALIGPRKRDGRYAFECTEVTEGALFEKWVGAGGKSVPIKKGAQNPVNYWPQEPRRRRSSD